MPKKNSLLEAPYGVRAYHVGEDENGVWQWEKRSALLEYVGGWEKDVRWKPNKPFRATMHLLSYERGRSAARFMWEDMDGTQYPMFMSGMLDLVQHGETQHGYVYDEKWIVVKRGSNYGIERYED